MSMFWCKRAALALAAFGGGSAARADCNAIVFPPDTTVCGTMASASTPDDGNAPHVAGRSWSVLATYNGDSWWLTPQANGDTVFYQASAPATFTLACRLTYPTPMGGTAPPPKILTATTGDTFPADLSIVSTNPQRQPCWQSDTWDFQVRDTGNQPCGGYLVGLAQERVYNRLDWWGNDVAPIDWSPASPSPGFYMSMAHIFDIHNPDLAGWNSLPIGATESALADLRIRFVYPGGVVNVNCPLRTLRYLITKAGATDWSESATLQ